MKRFIAKIRILDLKLKIKCCAVICSICEKIERKLYKYTTFGYHLPSSPKKGAGKEEARK